MSMYDADDADEDRHARIEEIFQRVEEESERRAQAAAAAEQARAKTTLANTQAEPALSASITPAAAASRTTVPGERRRGSVSVSRFGQTAAANGSGDVSGAETPTSAAAYVVNKGTFYAMQNGAHGSADSLASTAEANPASPGPSAYTSATEEESVVQMETISGRQSLSHAFSRRLSRSNTPSRGALNGVLIGVSVEQATVEHQPGDRADNEGSGLEMQTEVRKTGRARASSRSVVHVGDAPLPGMAAGPGVSELKTKASRADESEEEPRAEKCWIERARDLTRRLKRRSMMALGAAR